MITGIEYVLKIRYVGATSLIYDLVQFELTSFHDAEAAHTLAKHVGDA
jgi:hypothetical protein